MNAVTTIRVDPTPSERNYSNGTIEFELPARRPSRAGRGESDRPTAAQEAVIAANEVSNLHRCVKGAETS